MCAGEATDTPLRLGVIGAGFISQVTHLYAAASSPRIELVGLADGRAELLPVVARRFGVERMYSHHGELLADPDIEAVLVCVHRRCLAPLAVQALRNKKAVLSEKPMATSLAEGERVVAVAENEGLAYAVGYMKRHDVGVAAFRERFLAIEASGEMGRIVLVTLHDFCPTYGIAIPPHMRRPDSPAYRYDESVPAPHGLPQEWHADFDYWLNVAGHDLNLVRWLLRRTLVAQKLTVRSGRSQVAHLAADGFDILLHVGRSDSGDWDQRMEILFERGQMRLALPSPLARQGVAAGTVRAPGRDERIVVPPAEQVWSFVTQLENFAAAVRGSAALATPGHDSLCDLALSEQLWTRCDWHQ
jgi:predicted dehydrogenase